MSDTSADARLLIDAGIAMLRDSPSGHCYPDGVPVPCVEVVPGVWTDLGATVEWLREHMPPHDPWRDEYIHDLCDAALVEPPGGGEHYASATEGGWLVSFGPGLAEAAAEAALAFVDAILPEEAEGEGDDGR